MTITEFPIEPGTPPSAHMPRYIYVGPDANVWFADAAGSIGRMSTAGERFAPIVDAHQPVDLVTAADGTVWWTADFGRGRRLPDGTVQTKSGNAGYTIALTASQAVHWGMIVKDEGQAGSARLWAAAYENNTVRRLNATNDFDLQLDLPVGSGPSRLALASDGNLWVTMYDASAVDRITPAGARTRVPLPAGRGPDDIVVGPDGALWVTEYLGNRIGRMTIDGTLTNEFEIPTADSKPIGITAGPDGALWFTESNSGKIGRVRLDGPGKGGGAEAVVP